MDYFLQRYKIKNVGNKKNIKSFLGLFRIFENRRLTIIRVFEKKFTFDLKS